MLSRNRLFLILFRNIVGARRQEMDEFWAQSP